MGELRPRTSNGGRLSNGVAEDLDRRYLFPRPRFAEALPLDPLPFLPRRQAARFGLPVSG
jgi:hypothetical protein